HHGRDHLFGPPHGAMFSKSRAPHAMARAGARAQVISERRGAVNRTAGAYLVIKPFTIKIETAPAPPPRADEVEMTMSWTDDRVEQLKTMWTEGQSASQIAKALGGVTRNAVIGKVHRLGLSNRAAAKPAAPVEEAKPAAKPVAAPEPVVETLAPPEVKVVAAPAPRPIHSPGGRREPPPPTPAMVEEAQRTAETLAEMETKAKRLDLLELTERTCKWPIGDPATDDFFFCGLASQPGKPYCEAHVAVAFQPMSSRRDRRR